MSRKYPQFTIRLEQELIEKINYIAKFNSRTTPKEIEQLMKKHIYDFQDKNGKITFTNQ